MLVVEMLRFGNRESHSYVLGVYSTKAGARFAADKEEYRGGKYFAEINKFELDAPVPHAWD